MDQQAGTIDKLHATGLLDTDKNAKAAPRRSTPRRCICLPSRAPPRTSALRHAADGFAAWR